MDPVANNAKFGTIFSETRGSFRSLPEFEFPQVLACWVADSVYGGAHGVQQARVRRAFERFCAALVQYWQQCSKYQ
eukprot:3867044-Rhodomonas_salina.3